MRVVPVIEAIRDELPNIGISIDTRRPSVAMEALESGADMVNDVSSIGDPKMVEVVIEYDCPICIMHMSGKSKNMQENPSYDDVVSEVREGLCKICICA